MFRCIAQLCVFLLISLLLVPGAVAQEAIRGFVSVEPFEFRLEALVEVASYRELWDMDADALDPVRKPEVLEKLQALFESGVKVTSSGTAIPFTERTVRFVVLDVEKGYVPDLRENIPWEEAMVGLTLSAATEISEMELEWRWFAPGQEKLVVEIASRGKPSARELTPTANRASWKLDGKIDLPALEKIPVPTRIGKRPLYYLLFLGLAMVGCAGVLAFQKRKKSTILTGILAVGGIAFGLLALTVRTSNVVVPEKTAVEDLVYSLLRNTYHAFDFRDESAIYDTLEASVTGPLLEKVYLEMRTSLELENTGGARVRVYEIALRECQDIGTGNSTRGVFETRAEWVTIGEVTHWGHTHERTNKYEAEMRVTAVDDTWKISQLDLLNEERVQKVSRRLVSPES